MKLGWNHLARHAPWLLAAGVLLAVCAWVQAKGLAINGGRLSYALDDAYIHMATAKNLAQHGIWGVTRYEFTSACSSILWPILLAIGYRLHVNDWLPLALNAAFAVATLALAFACWQRVGGDRHRLGVAAGLVAMALLAPLPALVAGGMEHTLQAAVALAFTGAVAAAIAREAPPTWRTETPLWALAAAMGAVRYEGIFFVFVAAVLLLARRRFVTAVAIGVAGWLPIVAFGLYAMAHGAHFLPNSLLLKGKMEVLMAGEGLWGLRGLLRHNLTEAPLVALMLVGAAAVWAARWRRHGAWTFSQAYVALFAGGAALHLTFASVGWLFRYEAYLVVLGAVGFGLVALESLRRPAAWRRAALAGAALALVVTAWPRGASLQILPIALHDIYEQHVQMARFLGRYYAGQSVAANDIGAINFMGDLRCFDLVGLADLPVVMAKRAGTFGTPMIDRRSRERGVAIAVVYDSWFSGEQALPAHWKRVGTWTITHHVVVGSPTVSFYAVDPAAEPRLVASLRAFAPELPLGVVQAGPYTDGR